MAKKVATEKWCPHRLSSSAAGALIFVLCLFLHTAALSQQQPAMVANAPSPDQVEKQRLLDEKIEVIRKAFVAGNYAEVVRLCREADQIIPNTRSVQLYREWAYQRLQQSKVGQHADVEPSELSRAEQLTTVLTTSPAGSIVPAKPNVEKQSVSPATTSRETVPSPEPAQPPRRKPVNLPAIVIIAVAVIAAGIVAKRRIAARTSTSVSSPQPAPAEPKGGAPLPSSAMPKVDVEKQESSPQPAPFSSSPSPAPSSGLGLALGTPGLGLPSFGGGLSPQQPPLSVAASGEALKNESAGQEQPAPALSASLESPFVPDVQMPEPPPLTTDQEWVAPQHVPGEGPELPDLELAKGPDVPNIVSFDDLGINLAAEEPPPAPQKPYAARLDESKIVITPAPVSKAEEAESPSLPLNVDTEAETVVGRLPTDVPAIQLEDIIGGSSEEPVSEAVVSGSPSAEEKIGPPKEAVVGREVASPSEIPAGPGIGSVELEALTLDFAEGELDGLSTSVLEKSSGKPEASNEQASTVVVSPTTGIVSSDMGETQTLELPPQTPPDVALAETKAIELPTAFSQPASQPAGVAAPEEKETIASPKTTDKAAESAQPAAEGKKLDERSERMFLEQYQRGLRAFEEQNYKQAVHFLSIAAAIHPDNQEVREKLRLAREKKRQLESSR